MCVFKADVTTQDETTLLKCLCLKLTLQHSEEYRVLLTLLAAGDFCILNIEGTVSSPPDCAQDAVHHCH
jgi:hypothetical protein